MSKGMPHSSIACCSIDCADMPGSPKPKPGDKLSPTDSSVADVVVGATTAPPNSASYSNCVIFTLAHACLLAESAPLTWRSYPDHQIAR